MRVFQESECATERSGNLFLFVRIGSAILVACLLLAAAPSRSQTSQVTEPPFASMYSDAGLFLDAIRAEEPAVKPHAPLTGITVPHHLLAADLIARGFWAASAGDVDRVIILSPDHFHKAQHPLATTLRGICTPLGCVDADRAAVAMLLATPDLYETSGLFDHEHGIAALLPFVRHFFPKAVIVPIAISPESHRADWDKAIATLIPLLGPKTLVVQSTDFSHYLGLQASLQHDQETLNTLAAGDSNGVAALRSSDHLDSRGAEYIQLGLQRHLGAIGPIIVANRNASQYLPLATSLTTYIVQLFSPAEPDPATIRYADQKTYYFAGDVLLGRGFTRALLNPDARTTLVDDVRRITGGGSLIVNLEGYILHDPPPGLSGDAHVMNADIALPMLKELNVVAASLANNHAYDQGAIGLDATAAALKEIGVVPVREGEVADLGGLRLIALNFIKKRTIPGYPFVRDGDLAAICGQQAQPPFLAMVHWGREYTNTLDPGELDIASQLLDCGITGVVGVHSHKASTGIVATRGGAQQVTYSLGNFLFDQRGPRVSGSVLELRVFDQGTFAARLIPVPNLFERADPVAAN